MACCWYPIEYAGQAYTQLQAPNVSWYEDMGNFYMPGEYFDNPTALSREVAVGSFFTGRPQLFPEPDISGALLAGVMGRNEPDRFAKLREKLARLLFHETSYVRRVRIGHAGNSVLAFDCFRTGYVSSVGSVVNAIFLVLPQRIQIHYRSANGSRGVVNYGWDTPRMAESLQPGFFRHRNVDLSADDLRNWLITNESIIQNTFSDFTRLYQVIQGINDGSLVQLDARGNVISTSDTMLPFPEPPAIIRREFYVPDLTSDGGSHAQETLVYRALGAQRLSVELSREVEPYQDMQGILSERRVPPHYFIGVRRDAYDAAVLLGADEYPLPGWFSGLFHASTLFQTDDHGSRGLTTIKDYHESRYPGDFTSPVSVRVNGELQEDDNYSLPFLNVQDYAPPTDFPIKAVSEVPSDYSNYQIPVNYLDFPVGDLPVSTGGDFVFGSDFDVMVRPGNNDAWISYLDDRSVHHLLGFGWPAWRLPDVSLYRNVDMSHLGDISVSARQSYRTEGVVAVALARQGQEHRYQGVSYYAPNVSKDFARVRGFGSPPAPWQADSVFYDNLYVEHHSSRPHLVWLSPAVEVADDNRIGTTKYRAMIRICPVGLKSSTVYTPVAGNRVPGVYNIDGAAPGLVFLTTGTSDLDVEDSP